MRDAPLIHLLSRPLPRRRFVDLMLGELTGVMAPFVMGEARFDTSVATTLAMHEATMQRAAEQFQAQKDLESALHRRQRQLVKELYYRDMAHAIDVARREALRDVWSQKNQLHQTLMIINAVMFSCAFSLSAEATAAQGTPIGLLQCYSATCALALGLLSVSVLLTIKLQARMARYNMTSQRHKYTCGGTHPTFDAFFACHCRGLERGAFGSFYVGTMCTVASAALDMGSISTAQFPSSVTAMWIFVAVLVLAFNAPMVLWPATREAPQQPETAAAATAAQ